MITQTLAVEDIIMAVIRDDQDYKVHANLAEEKRLIEADIVRLEKKREKIEYKMREIEARCPLVRKK